MSSSAQIGLFATGLWEELGSPSDIAANTISGWVSQDQTLGKLNNLIGTCFSGVGYSGVGTWNYDVSPDLSNLEFGILDQMYRVTYYQRLIRNIAGAGGTFPVQQMAEGDSKIQFVSAAELAKVYTDNLKNAQDQMKYLVNAYIKLDYAPRSVDFYTILPQQYSRTGGQVFS